jgi:hypothetical protein
LLENTSMFSKLLFISLFLSLFLSC